MQKGTDPSEQIPATVLSRTHWTAVWIQDKRVWMSNAVDSHLHSAQISAVNFLGLAPEMFYASTSIKKTSISKRYNRNFYWHISVPGHPFLERALFLKTLFWSEAHFFLLTMYLRHHSTSVHTATSFFLSFSDATQSVFLVWENMTESLQQNANQLCL